MHEIASVRSFEAIKVLADARRLEILQLLMATPATLTQLGKQLKRSPAWIRHHIAALLRAGLVQPDRVRVVGRATEKYYRAAAGGLLLEQLVLPRTRLPVVVFAGSHDPALQAMADTLGGTAVFVSMYVGSLNGLMNLRQGICHVSGAHLLDEGGDFNRPYVRHFFADRAVELVTLAHRTQGLMVAPGNPKAIRSLQDLTRPAIRFLNRNAGSGTRVWLDQALRRRGIDPASIRGYQREVCTHTLAASMVKAGKADAALGLQAAAYQDGLGFIPLFEERYDLVLQPESERLLGPFLDFIQSAAFRANVHTMTGYNTAHSGDLIRM